ncbi:hypothetical protein HN51_048247 [Arachis hypogaea]|uniref:Uncharacterized protein n=2 Tax=Arachis TaxID=3817 RepID=A0A445AK66_ARAHY|nr:hypothetical protein Ahy_B02g061157 [Arachis hypogaea]
MVLSSSHGCGCSCGGISRCSGHGEARKGLQRDPTRLRKNKVRFRLAGTPRRQWNERLLALRIHSCCIYEFAVKIFFTEKKTNMTPDKNESEWMIPVEVMLGSLDHGEVQACSISRIPDEIRAPKEECYKPRLVSVGPLHRGATRQILLMEEPKWRYAKSFLDRRVVSSNQGQAGGRRRSSEPGTREWGQEILKFDKLVRASYGGDLDLDPHDLAKIMMVDGCFLLELLHKLVEYMNSPPNQSHTFSNDPFLETEEKVQFVLNDISMLENQIPFIVLKKLYNIVFPDKSKVAEDHRVADIMHNAFGYNSKNHRGLAHMLHLMHLSTVEEDNNQEAKRLRQACQELKRCATRLRAAGITIKSTNSNSIGNGSPNGNVNANPSPNNQHKIVDIFDFNISFNEQGKILEIPALHIKETTEARWRNLIAWEQSRIWIRGKYTSYALFFQTLICCEHDLEFLEKKGVIVNEFKKSKDEIMTTFRTISDGVDHMDSSYSDHYKKLNAHQTTLVTKMFHEWPIITWHRCRRVLETLVFYWWNWLAILIRDHIPTVWKFFGVVAAIVLLVLTIMQTYYSAKQTHYAAEQAHNATSGS